MEQDRGLFQEMLPAIKIARRYLQFLLEQDRRHLEETSAGLGGAGVNPRAEPCVSRVSRNKGSQNALISAVDRKPNNDFLQPVGEASRSCNWARIRIGLHSK